VYFITEEEESKLILRKITAVFLCIISWMELFVEATKVSAILYRYIGKCQAKNMSLENAHLRK